MIHDHDEERGVPVHDEMKAVQCSLNWNMMIQKREIFRGCLDNFDFDKVVVYGETDIDALWTQTG